MRWCSHNGMKWPRAHGRRKPLWQRGLTVHGVLLDVVLLTHQKILPPESGRRRESLSHKGFRRRLLVGRRFRGLFWGETFHPDLPRLHLLFSGRAHGHWLSLAWIPPELQWRSRRGDCQPPLQWKRRRRGTELIRNGQENAPVLHDGSDADRVPLSAPTAPPWIPLVPLARREPEPF